jgi:hypothetical protein
MNKAKLSLKALVLVSALGLGLMACLKAPTAAEVKAMMDITDVTTKWVAKAYTPWPQRLILVPTISLRVKNIMNKPLKFIDINAVFAFKGDPQNLGENFRMVIDSTPVRPGEKTQLFTFISPYGFDGRNLTFIKNHPWWNSKVVEAKIFATTKGSGPVLLGTWMMSKDIDFKEPETPGQKKVDVNPAPIK